MKLRALGVVFVTLMLASVWATYGVFTKKFTDYDEVMVRASKIGLQLPMRADVKIKGVIVGEVLDYEPTADGADITLGLYQDRTTDIPEDVTASILPKTLFGEKFVSLVVPEGGGSAQSCTCTPGAPRGASQANADASSIHSRTAWPCWPSAAARRQHTPTSPKLSITRQKMSQTIAGLLARSPAAESRQPACHHDRRPRPSHAPRPARRCAGRSRR